MFQVLLCCTWSSTPGTISSKAAWSSMIAMLARTVRFSPVVRRALSSTGMAPALTKGRMYPHEVETKSKKPDWYSRDSIRAPKVRLSGPSGKFENQFFRNFVIFPMLCRTREGSVAAFSGWLRTGQPLNLLTLRVKSRTTIGSVVGLLIPASIINTTLALWSLPSTTPSSCQIHRLVKDSTSSFGLFSCVFIKRNAPSTHASKPTIIHFNTSMVVACASIHSTRLLKANEISIACLTFRLRGCGTQSQRAKRTIWTAC